jgi:hypothetical protein
MHDIRLIRAMTAPNSLDPKHPPRGPGYAMYGLQEAMRANKPDWLHIGGELQDGEIPWFWCWLDRFQAVMCSDVGRPFIIGPNMLFCNWTKALAVPGEKELCNSASCRLQFTESAWYRDWILENCGPAMQAPIVTWPYPLHPIPYGSMNAAYDLLIYAKSGPINLANKLARMFPKSITLRYGHFERQELWNAARQCRACAYLSNNDRGPLALAEILHCGCPAVGIERGAPWINDKTGIMVEELAPETVAAGVREAWKINRETVRAYALQYFAADRVLPIIYRALDEARYSTRKAA